MARTYRRDTDDCDDAYDELSRRRRKTSSGNGTVVLVLLIVGSVFLMVFLAFGGLIVFVVYSAREAEKGQAEHAQRVIARHTAEMRAKQEANTDKATCTRFVAAFYREMKEARFDAAFRMTSSAYRKRVSKEAFQKFFKPHVPLLQRFTTMMGDPFAPDAGIRYIFRQDYNVSGVILTLELTAVREGDDWKVDQLTFDGDGP